MTSKDGSSDFRSSSRHPMRIKPYLLALCLFATAARAGVDGSFIQLTRDKAERETEAWREDFRRIKSLGGSLVIVQWTAEEPVLYFHPTTPLPGMTEEHPAVERILEAAEAEGLGVVLGLQHQPEYWRQLEGRDKVLRDFFRIRLSRNERLQRALLKAFGGHKAWRGYYIPDEVDDLNWRAPEKQEEIHAYLRTMAERLGRNDSNRFVAVSAFFRGRTEPDRLVRNFVDIFAGTGISYLLVQDGVGVGDPPVDYVSAYHEAFSRGWTPEAAGARGPLPTRWCVIEAFAQTSAPGQPFAAVPAPPERLRQQVEAARPHYQQLILYTYQDYLCPELSPEAAASFQSLQASP